MIPKLGFQGYASGNIQISNIPLIEMRVESIDLNKKNTVYTQAGDILTSNEPKTNERYIAITPYTYYNKGIDAYDLINFKHVKLDDNKLDELHIRATQFPKFKNN